MFEVVTGIWRFGEGGGTYHASCVLVFDGEVTTLKGLSSPITKEDVKELRRFLKSRGVCTVRYKRKDRWKTCKI